MTKNEIVNTAETIGQNIMGVIFGALALADEVSVWVAAGVGITVIIYNYFRIKDIRASKKLKQAQLQRELVHLRKEEIEMEIKELELEEIKVKHEKDKV